MTAAPPAIPRRKCTATILGRSLTLKTGPIRAGTADARVGTMEHSVRTPAERRQGPLSRNTKLALLSVAAIVAFFVLREHWSHALGLAPYLLLLLCPLMHLFGHGRHHGRHGGQHDHESNGA